VTPTLKGGNVSADLSSNGKEETRAEESVDVVWG